ncbi:DNA-3-methyladenine glycosylase I [Rhodococcus sp. AD45-ID]|uniref:DNA-3-methyladenine glycosylase I n=1 Tax=Nocardia globerula TaxID=1818 RepID=A0A652YSN3_NOCGL|nr:MULTISPECIES: DNA-3-methyladenine glycosylase I [Rhodococcus]KJF21601.1 DNA-3-methyladenine glycosylase 1 [Rhodococcus sp. AD45]NMD61580.1 DNA-3-methyladenine glycosylase I [Nocardia globerula]PSR39061.1 DNA-3-methyladenine glycosylase I [Rhodococcus sp. AD45-ID]PVX66868.1 DNA-3-methyladenine glycosylase I [Rhodococcus globerulus]
MSDGIVRCDWVIESPGDTLYRDYHDQEWGQPLHGRDALFERLALEAFQSGLSWITILRKRDAFRSAFDGFVPGKVAEYGQADVDRLLADSSIIRNRAKIEATISNARVLVNSPELDLDALLWSFAPPRRTARLASIADVPAITEESTAMAKELKRLGFKFIGPTTAYALMQATGMVDDHIAECWVPPVVP